MKHRMLTLFLAAFMLACPSLSGQNAVPPGEVMAFEVIDGDTVYVDILEPAVITRKGKRPTTPKEWRKQARLIYNFNKVYPYALVGRKMMAQVDSTLAADEMKRAERNKYISDVEKELFTIFEEDIKTMTITQGYVLLRLVDRECGLSPYEIIQTYISNFAANFWQLIAKLFSNDLKEKYDPFEKDALIEDLVQIWDSGQWDEFYIAVMGKAPTKTVISTEKLTNPKKKTKGRKSK